MAKTSETPLMQQHSEIKKKHPDAILLFRVGDFYETFGSDALVVSKVLGITLTKRNGNIEHSTPLAGFPYHALDTYLHKLVKAGHRVALCEQLENPKLVKAGSIVKRGITEMITPGVAVGDKLIDNDNNNFLAALHIDKELVGLALVDISTGEFFAEQGSVEYVNKLLQTLKPSEVVYQRGLQTQLYSLFGEHYFTYPLDSWVFDQTHSYERLLHHFEVQSLKGFGIEEQKEAIVAAAAALQYLKDTEHHHLKHLHTIQRLNHEAYMWMDSFTIRNLELMNTGQETTHSLLKTMDSTSTPMGTRLLKRWLVMPLKEITKINERLSVVEFALSQPTFVQTIVPMLKQCGDVERLISKLPLKKINPREVVLIAKALGQIASIKTTCQTVENEYLQRIADALNPCLFIADRIRKLMVEQPPILVSKGGCIQDGVDASLDELRYIVSHSKESLINIQIEEAEKTGISSLKIGFNAVFGYYLEVTNLHKNKVPKHWIRKQTLTGAERYITPELKDYEEKIVGAEEKIEMIEQTIYDNLLLELQDYIAPLQINGTLLATIDCLLCFAHNAQHHHYCKPLIHEGFDLSLQDSRHPVLEQFCPPGAAYIPNHIQLGTAEQQLIILTGPNMSGKSALLRQVGLITLMAHMGSYVPASAATIPLTDSLFTRVGASDNISGGESTFMVEMNETASILNNHTARSLILLDEIGRGTSTYDGISIAWSIVEYLHESPHKPKTLFATHYHELNHLEEKLDRVKNYHITNKEVGNKILFLRKLALGGSTTSFGIHVARMAGMPRTLIGRAEAILKTLEAQPIHHFKLDAIKNLTQPLFELNMVNDNAQLLLEKIKQQLAHLDINRITPVEGLLKLKELQNILNRVE